MSSKPYPKKRHHLATDAFPSPNPPTSSRLKRLERLLEHYPHFEEWCKTPDCFLTDVELLVLTCFLEHKTASAVVRQLEWSHAQVTTRLKWVEKKLRKGINVYRDWEYCHFSQYRFLQKPLVLHPIPVSTLNRLDPLGANFAEVLEGLHNTGQSLLELRGIGERGQLALEHLFERHDCTHLLTQSQRLEYKELLAQV